MIPDAPDVTQLITESSWISLVYVLLLYSVAFLIGRHSLRVASWFLKIQRTISRNPARLFKENDRKQGLLAGLITLIFYILATLSSLALFVDSSSLIWFIGLFSAGFGIAARPIISDYLTGLSLMFEDSFEVGEKVELPGVLGGHVEGIVEVIHLRTTLIRARSGEPFIVPNGEIRVVRNYSRAKYSESKIKIKIHSKDARKSVNLLETMSDDTVLMFENVIEPWRVISESGEMGAKTVLTIVFHTKFGMAAIARPKLLYFIQERFEEAGITLED